MQVSNLSEHVESLAKQIFEDFQKQVLTQKINKNQIALIGIRCGGEVLANKLSLILKQKYNLEIKSGCLDITLYRDDSNISSPSMPILRASEIDFSLDNLFTVLVDDVLFTGRTVRAALEALNDYGRASKIKLAVLVDRDKETCRELPISADFFGVRNFESKDKRVKILFEEDQIVIS